MKTSRSTSRLRIGVIGLGYWGPKLARNFCTLPDVDLAWACDLDPDRLAHVKELCPDVRTTRDHHELLNSDVDGIVIATPASTHYSLAMEALRCRKHILVEKPLALRATDAMDIAETADRLQLAAMVGHTFQYNPAVNTVRRLIESGELGQPYYASTERVNLGLLQSDINVLWDLAPHDVSILLHVLDCDPYQVSASGHTYIQKRHGLHEVAFLTLYFPTGVMANIRVSWLDPVKQRRMVIVGSRKMLVYDDIAEDKVVLYDKGVDRPAYSDTPEQFNISYRHGGETVVPVKWDEPLRLECEAFANWICTGERAPSHAWMGAKVVQILETAQKSLLDSGARVNTDL